MQGIERTLCYAPRESVAAIGDNSLIITLSHAGEGRKLSILRRVMDYALGCPCDLAEMLCSFPSRSTCSYSFGRGPLRGLAIVSPSVGLSRYHCLARILGGHGDLR